MPALKLQKRGLPQAKSEEWWRVGRRNEAGALDFKSRMFGWGLSSQINNPQPYSKQRVAFEEGLDHLISISPPQRRGTSHL